MRLAAMISTILAVTVCCCACLAFSGSVMAANTAKPAGLRHVVLFKFKDSATPENIATVEKAFIALPKNIDVVRDFEWGTNNSPENKAQGFTHCFFLTFKDAAGRALARLAEGHVDLVMLDLTLPDSRGSDTFTRIYARFPEVPIIVLTCMEDKDLAVRLIQEGAQDYIVKGQVGINMLAHAIRELVADFHDRVKRIHGTLENDRDLAPAELSQFNIIHFQDVPALEDHLPAGDQGRRVQDAQDGVGNRGFATAGLTGQTDHFARLNGDGNPVHRLNRPARGQVSYSQVPDIQQRVIRQWAL